MVEASLVELDRAAEGDDPTPGAHPDALEPRRGSGEKIPGNEMSAILTDFVGIARRPAAGAVDNPKVIEQALNSVTGALGAMGRHRLDRGREGRDGAGSARRRLKGAGGRRRPS